MKCPKCGFTSFDYLDTCKKCGTDVSAVRSMLGVIAIAPEDRAVASPTSRAMPASEIPPADDLFGPASGAGFLGDLSEPASEPEPEAPLTMDSMVEHTSYAAAKPAAQSAAATAGDEDEEEFLPMADFEDIFKE